MKKEIILLLVSCLFLSFSKAQKQQYILLDSLQKHYTTYTYTLHTDSLYAVPYTIKLYNVEIPYPAGSPRL